MPSDERANMCSMSEGEERRCGRCKEVKPIDAFRPRPDRPGQRDTFCPACRSAYGKEHYAKHRQRYIDQAAVVTARKRRERTEWLFSYFAEHPCVDCGEDDPVVLEFDHLGDKRFDVGTGIADRPWQTLLDEIARCEVVCANCHRRRTAVRRNSVRVQLTRERLAREADDPA